MRWIVTFWLLLIISPMANADDSVIELLQARFALASQDNLDKPSMVDSATMTVVTLPDGWIKRGLPEKGYGWYRLDVLAPKDQATLWAYIPRASTNAHIFFNGVLLWSGGIMVPHPAQNWSRSPFFPLSSNLFKNEHNHLDILLGVDGNEPGLLGPVYLGDMDTLQHWLRWHEFAQREGYFITSGILLAVGCFLIFLWLRTRSEPRYAYLGFGSLMWSLRVIEQLVSTGDVEATITKALDLFADAAACISELLIYLFMFSLISDKHRRLDRMTHRTLWICMIATVSSVLLSPWAGINVYSILSFWLWILLPLELYIITRLILSACKRKEGPLIQTAVLGIVWFMAQAYDGLVTLQILPGHWLYVGDYAGLILFSCFATLTISHYSRLLHDYQVLSQNLEHRVYSHQQRIEQQYLELTELDRQRAVLEERDRMMRDLHDGLGSQLVGAIHEVRSSVADPKQIEDVLARCLDELRIAIESIDPDTMHLPTMLGALRYRMEKRLHDAGIALTWAIEDVPQLEKLDPTRAVNILRVLQEAFTNTIKHARASNIVVSLSQLREAVKIKYQDDGVGITDLATTGGRGIGNMRKRAHAADATFELHSESSGTTIVLQLPFDAISTDSLQTPE